MPVFEGDLRLFLGLATLGAMAVLSFLVVFLSARGIRRQWRESAAGDSAERFPDREPLTLDQFYEVFYAGEKLPRTVVLEAVGRFAAATHVPAQFLKPDDTFQSVGASEHHADDCEKFVTDTAMLLHVAEERYGVSLFSGKLVTLDDYIRVHVLASRLVTGTAAAKAKT
ncbi:MAG: hypothetical protein ABIP81_06735 [Terriglobales bacterium]